MRLISIFQVFPIFLVFVQGFFFLLTVKGQSVELEKSGWIRFSTQGAGIMRPDGFDVDRSAYAELWVGKSVGTMKPIAGPIQLNQNLRFEGGVVPLAGSSPGETVSVQLKVCIGTDFESSVCCGLSPVIDYELFDRSVSGHRESLFFGWFGICSDCDPDSCNAKPYLKIARRDRTIGLTWYGGRVEFATKVTGPFRPITPGIVLSLSGERGFPRSSVQRYYRLINPCFEPEPIFSDLPYIAEGRLSPFYEEYLVRLLKVMGEPPIRALNVSSGSEIYRMIFLPSGLPPTVVRFQGDGDKYFKKTILTGPYGSEVQRCILYQSVETLTKTEWDRFKEDLNRVDIESLSESEVIPVFLDGVSAYLEVVNDMGSYFIDRSNPSYQTEERGLEAYRDLFDKYPQKVLFSFSSGAISDSFQFSSY